MSAKDKAGKDYWDSVWEDFELTEVANPQIGGVKNVTIRLMDKTLREALADLKTKGLKMLEVGCANSVWLPYFAKELGFDVTGLDYSELGCESERKVLKNSGVRGDIMCADFFAPPAEAVEKFDVVSSFGVVEHFVPTEGCLKAFARFLKQNGRILTVIPNVQGSIGFLMKLTNRPFYDKHVSLSPKTLAAAHEKAGFEVLSSKYVMSNNFYVPNTTGLDQNAISTKVKNAVLQNLGRFSLVTLALGEKIDLKLTSKLFSPYIICVGRKK